MLKLSKMQNANSENTVFLLTPKLMTVKKCLTGHYSKSENYYLKGPVCRIIGIYE